MRKFLNEVSAFSKRVVNNLLSPRVRKFMKGFTTTIFIFMVFVVPCILNLENMKVCITYAFMLVISAIMARVFNPHFFRGEL